MASSLTGCVSGIGTYVFSNEKSHYWSTTVLLMVMWKNSNEVVKLPSNTTSLIQCCDVGIIRALKHIVTTKYEPELLMPSKMDATTAAETRTQ